MLYGILTVTQNYLLLHRTLTITQYTYSYTVHLQLHSTLTNLPLHCTPAITQYTYCYKVLTITENFYSYIVNLQLHSTLTVTKYT